MLNFTDIIKGKFLEEFAAISVTDALVAIVLSFLLSLFIIYIYRVTYGGVSYSRSFANCLMMLSMVTTVVILVVSSNVVLSLGMVGALSIVRFRTAVKEATDTSFLFWAIATGIICGAGYVTISILITLLLGLLFVIAHAFSGKKKSDSYLVVIRYNGDTNVERRLASLPAYKMKNKSITGEYTELVAEMRLTDNNMVRVEALRNESGVEEISIMRSVSGSVL
ncbi:MAG: DUF4956 domain-containing protein [Oscillospiraceae bacterium]|nr:DUF4956 domain-containing protein [Oscillospiraceae bacterium]